MYIWIYYRDIYKYRDLLFVLLTSVNRMAPWPVS